MPIINPAHQFLTHSRKEVGSYALDLANLAAGNIPLPTTYCLPVSTLKLIARHNHLSEKFSKIVKSINRNSSREIDLAVTQVQKLILKQGFPPQVSRTLLRLYTKHFDKDYVRLTASPTDGNQLDFKREENIQGEANLMESILMLWARNIDPKDIKAENLFPVAIVIQSQAQPAAAGLAYSLNPLTGDKSYITLTATYGVYDHAFSPATEDSFEVEQNSTAIVKQQISEKKMFLHRQPDELEQLPVHKALQTKPCINQKQVFQLASITRQIKLLFPHHIMLHWELLEGDFIITKIKPFHYSPTTFSLHQNYKLILRGTGVTTGFVESRCLFIKSPADISKIKPGDICVVEQLTQKLQALIHLCSAIICIRDIDNSYLLQQVRHYQIPTVINAKAAFILLKNQAQVAVDGSSGRIYLSKSLSNLDPSLYQESKLKLFLAINSPQEIDQSVIKISSGVGLLRSEHYYIKNGQHPKQFLKQRSNEFQEQLINDLSLLYHRYIAIKQQKPLLIYRMCNLHSNQLIKLKGGNTHEINEENPFIGFRGGLRNILQPELAKFEIETLNKINQKLDQPINCMLPFVRSSLELEKIWQLIEQASAGPVFQPPVWLQITTPENLLNIEPYLRVPISGLAINTKTIHALLTGVDPNLSDIYHQYAINHSFLKSAIERLVSFVRKNDTNIKVFLILSEFNEQLIKIAQVLELDGLCIPPKLVTQTKQYLLEHL